MNITFEKKVYPVVFDYYEDYECSVYLFDDEEEAWQFAKDNMVDYCNFLNKEMNYRASLEIKDDIKRAKISYSNCYGKKHTATVSVGNIFTK